MAAQPDGHRKSGGGQGAGFKIGLDLAWWLTRLSRYPHVPFGPSSAIFKHVINVGVVNGFARKLIAPALMARARTASLGKAVMNMKGALWPRLRICPRKSSPFMHGIWTSVITQEVSRNSAELRNSSAETKVWTMYPYDVRRLFVALRTDGWSSTIEITEGIDKMMAADRGTACRGCGCKF